MFQQLVESNNHVADFKRRGLFLIVTTLFYGALLTVAGVAGVYAYDAHLGAQELELTSLAVEMLPPPEEKPISKPIIKPRSPDTPSNPNQAAAAPRAEVFTPNVAPDKVNINSTHAPTAPVVFRDGQLNRNIGAGAPNGRPFDTDDSNGGGKDGEINTAPPTMPPPVKKETPAPPVKRTETISLGVVNAKMLNKPVLSYPNAAKLMSIQGTVSVQITIDETGRVIASHATNGHPLLRDPAEKAALQARFSPTLLSRQAVRATGVITFNFTLAR